MKRGGQCFVGVKGAYSLLNREVKRNQFLKARKIKQDLAQKAGRSYKRNYTHAKRQLTFAVEKLYI